MEDLHYPEDFHVVWNGGPLLPERPSHPSRLWQLSAPHGNDHATKRIYAKKDQQYWEGRAALRAVAISDVQCGPADPTGQATATRVGD